MSLLKLEQYFVVIADDGSEDGNAESMAMMIEMVMMMMMMHCFTTEAHEYLLSSEWTVYVGRLKMRGHYA